MKKNKSKEAKFFCESCQSEVPNNSKFCPTCGKFFCSVRCPSCGLTGDNKLFVNGCPECGYAFTPQNNKQNKLNQRFFKMNQKKHQKDFSLPLWVYICSISTLIIVIIGLYSCLIK